MPRLHVIVLAAMAQAICVGTSWADEPAAKGKFQFEERVVAGGPDRFMEVRHLALRGTNVQIGRKLAEIARQRYGVQPDTDGDPLIMRTQRRYLEANYPALYERMHGVAECFGGNIGDDNADFTGLGYLIGAPGCSVVFYPPKTTAEGVGVLSRNFDFTTGTLRGTAPPVGKPGVCGRPYVIEMYPDRGYASLYVCCFDLLSGATDGINSEGLCVAMLADDEIIGKHKIDPTMAASVGLDEIQIVRYLLDTCANVDEAKAALLSVKHYYSFIPCHYIIADRYGKSFVWERSYPANRQHIIDGPDKPQITTNFMLHRHSDLDDLPKERHASGHFNRFRKLRDRITAHTGKLDLASIKDNNACIAMTHGSAADGEVTERTLWHSLYVPERRSLEVDFYLGDEPGKTERIARSGYVKFQLRR